MTTPTNNEVEDDTGWNGHIPTLTEATNAAFEARGLTYQATGDAAWMTVSDGATVIVAGPYADVWAWIESSGVLAMPFIVSEAA